MAGHTPGPWTVSPLNGRDVGPVRAFTFEGTDVQQLQSVALVRARAESDANARLIAAAPELLAALKTVKPWFELWLPDAIGPAEQNLLRLVDAAIAKAEGR